MKQHFPQIYLLPALIWWMFLFWLPDFLGKRYGLDLKTFGPPVGMPSSVKRRPAPACVMPTSGIIVFARPTSGSMRRVNSSRLAPVARLGRRGTERRARSTRSRSASVAATMAVWRCPKCRFKTDCCGW